MWPSSADEADSTAEVTAESIADRLGWLDSIEWMQPRAALMQAWAEQIAQSGYYDRVILLGMGGSSLAAAVFAALFEPAPGYLPVVVIDTTHPDEIARIAGNDVRRCLFIVASKSGRTVETINLYHFFRAQLAAQCADTHAKSHTEAHTRFVMITDEGSDLHRLAQAKPCHEVFINPADVGGRYSALSYFGMLPAALLGVDVGELLSRAAAFCETTKSDDPAENQALAFGMFLGRSALAGKDKMILQLPAQLGVFGLWIEQLIAESTGKDGKGLVPVIVCDRADTPEHKAHGGEDRINIRIAHSGVRGESGDDQDDAQSDAQNNGEKSPASQSPASQSPDWQLRLDDPRQLGAEFFRWEIATAIAATNAFLGVNPFNQPDVANSKNRTGVFIRGREQIQSPVYRGAHYDLHYPAAEQSSTKQSSTKQSGAEVIANFRRSLVPGGYLGLLAYLPEDERTVSQLQSLRTQITERCGIVATLGFGPRYLHSTGQLHKGGPRSGRFIQFIADEESDHENDLAVPQHDYTFAQLYRAQADGDFSALAQMQPAVVMRVALKADRLRALAVFISDFTSNFTMPLTAAE